MESLESQSHSDVFENDGDGNGDNDDDDGTDSDDDEDDDSDDDAGREKVDSGEHLWERKGKTREAGKQWQHLPIFEHAGIV